MPDGSPIIEVHVSRSFESVGIEMRMGRIVLAICHDLETANWWVFERDTGIEQPDLPFTNTSRCNFVPFVGPGLVFESSVTELRHARI